VCIDSLGNNMMEKIMEEKFGFMYDRMTRHYSLIESMIGDMYTKVKENPYD